MSQYNFVDLIGKKVGRLKIIKREVNDKYGSTQWLCECSCGNKKIINGKKLRNKKTLSCGCLQKEYMSKTRRDNLIGKKFNKIKITSLSHIKNRRCYWNYVCECGNTGIVSSSDVKRMESCGCNRRKHYDTFLTAKYLHYKNGAKKRGIEFNLSKDFFNEKINEICFYCGKSSSNIYKNKTTKETYFYNGIDRIDSKKGYTINNVVSCCSTCNIVKLAMPREEFLKWIEKVYNHSIKNKNLVEQIKD